MMLEKVVVRWSGSLIPFGRKVRGDDRKGQLRCRREMLTASIGGAQVHLVKESQEVRHEQIELCFFLLGEEVFYVSGHVLPTKVVDIFTAKGKRAVNTWSGHLVYKMGTKKRRLCLGSRQIADKAYKRLTFFQTRGHRNEHLHLHSHITNYTYLMQLSFYP